MIGKSKIKTNNDTNLKSLKNANNTTNKEGIIGKSEYYFQ